MGTIIVKAADDSGVYEVAKQYNPARAAVRAAAQLPRVFYAQPAPMVRTSLSYAPTFQSLFPAPATGKRSVDSARNDSRRATVSGTTRSVQISPKPSREIDDEDFAEAFLSSRTSYCVRSCDGFYFPVGNPDGGDLAAHESACARACPDAETAVYVASAGSKGIEDAVNRKGVRYEALKTAFNHRTQYDNACTCNSSKRNYSVMTDFTLRKGDMVMSGEGLRVFRGTETYPYRKADFGRPETAKLSAAERASLEKLEAASLRGPASGQLSSSLKARISAQVNAVRPQSGAGVNKMTTNVARKIVQDGREMRYVGPDLDFDRAR